MVNCAVNNCARKADKAKGIRLFCIPSVLKNQCAKTLFLSRNRRAFWIERINKTALQLEDIKAHTRICSRHFVKGQPSALFDHKNPDWAPSLHMGYDENILVAIIERQERILFEGLSVLPVPPDPSEASMACSFSKPSDVTPVKEIVVCEVSVNDMLMEEDEEVEDGNCDEVLVETRTEVSGDLLQDMKQLIEEVEFYKIKLEVMKSREEELHQKLVECNQDNSHLKHQVAALTADNANWQKTVLLLFLNEDTLKDDDAKVAYYTGLPTFSVLMQTYELVSAKIPNSSLYVLPKFQQFLLCLMRICLNLQVQDLGYRFNVSQATVSRIFHKWLPAMNHALGKYIVWPDRETIIESTPLCFKKEVGDSVGVIVSCLEILTEKSTAIVSKSHAVKFLIGMTPQGTVYHTSRSYFGELSLKIVEESGVLDKLLPDDIVLMHKGFNESGGDWVKARVSISASGKPKLSSERKLSKKFVNVSFNVDRLCGNLKRKFSMLRSILNVDYLTKKDEEEYPQLDLIVRVCCALANICPPTAFE